MPKVSKIYVSFSVCTDGTCQHGGTCDETTHHCNCTEDYTGATCDLKSRSFIIVV